MIELDVKRRPDISTFVDHIKISKLLLNSCSLYRVARVRREANFVAHRIARIVRSVPSPCIWVEPPNIFMDALHDNLYSCT